MLKTENKFIEMLLTIARKSGMEAPLIVAWPNWTLLDASANEYGTPLAVATFTSPVDIFNRISDEAAAYVLRQQVAGEAL